MKSKNYNDIFSEQGCIERDILIRYAKGTLDTNEKYHVEKHLVDCPLCSDALEGFMLFNGNIDMAEIDSNIGHMSIGNTKTGFRKYYAAAAALATIVLLSYVVITLLRDVPEARIAVATEKDKGVTPVPAIKYEEQVIADSEAVMSVHKSIPLVSPPVKEMDDETPAADFASQAGSIATSEDQKDELQKRETIPVAENVTYIDNLKVLEPSMQDERSAEAGSEITTQSTKAMTEKKSNAVFSGKEQNYSTSGNNYNNRLADGLALFNKGRYQAAIQIFNELIGQDPADENALFYKGLSNYHLENYEQAIQQLEPFHKDSKHPFYAEAEYYIASSLTRSGETKKGEYMLNNIITNKGFNHQQAVEELNRIKE